MTKVDQLCGLAAKYPIGRAKSPGNFGIRGGNFFSPSGGISVGGIGPASSVRYSANCSFFAIGFGAS